MEHVIARDKKVEIDIENLYILSEYSIYFCDLNLLPKYELNHIF